MNNLSDNNWWQSPNSLQALAACLKYKSKDSLLLAGGTDLIPAWGNDLWEHSIIDLSKIPQLKQIRVEDKNITVGAGVTHSQLAQSEIIQKNFLALNMAAGQVGSQQIRNRGTIGGNIANGSAAADLLPVLFALKAKVQILKADGDIDILPIEDFFNPDGSKALLDNQCIVGFVLPLADDAISSFVKLGSRSQVTIAQISAAAVIKQHQEEKMVEAKIWLGAIALRPQNFPEADYLFAQGDIAGAAAVVANYIAKNVPPKFDCDYKSQVIYGLLTDLLQSLKNNGISL